MQLRGYQADALNKYTSAIDAAKAIGVSKTTICSWCDGYITKSGAFSQKRNDCWSELKYMGENK